MSGSYDQWHKHYQDVGSRLRTDEQQFRNQVRKLNQINSDDPKLPPIRYDHLHAGIQYNHFINDEGRTIQKDIQAIEHQLKNTPDGTFHHQSLEKQREDQNQRFSAWSQVLIEDKHKAVQIDEVHYQGKAYSMDQPPRWDKSTTQGVVQRGVEWAGEAAQHVKESLTPSRQTQQALCNTGVGMIMGEMIPNPAGSGLSGAPIGEALGRAMQGGPSESCRQTFPTENDGLKKELKQHGIDRWGAVTDLPAQSQSLLTHAEDKVRELYIREKLNYDKQYGDRFTLAVAGLAADNNMTRIDMIGVKDRGQPTSTLTIVQKDGFLLQTASLPTAEVGKVTQDQVFQSLTALTQRQEQAQLQPTLQVPQQEQPQPKARSMA